MVEYTISTCVDGNVLKVFWSYCSEVGIWNRERECGAKKYYALQL